jgi:glycosyltransferase involved in cell wall biosynthesis
VRERDIDQWREAWTRCLAQANQVLCFSNASADLVRRAYPNLDRAKIEVCPHKVDYLSQRKVHIKSHGALHIGVVGEIRLHKGSLIVSDLARVIAKHQLPVRITVVGTIDSAVDTSVVDVTGSYERDELATKIEQSGINLCLIPSIWPETFSYVAEELMLLELPLAVFDLGAPAERVRKYHRGLVLGTLNPEEVVNKLLEFHSQLTQKTGAGSVNGTAMAVE